MGMVSKLCSSSGPPTSLDAVVHADNLIFANTHGLLLKSGDYNDTGLHAVCGINPAICTRGLQWALCPFSVQGCYVPSRPSSHCCSMVAKKVVIGLNLCLYTKPLWRIRCGLKWWPGAG